MDDKDSEQRGRAIVQSLAVIVQSMLQPTESLPTAYTARSKFEAFRAPNISIRDYLMRINKYAACSPECFVLALVYIDRLHQMQGLILTDLNVHRVLITSVVLAAKFFDDHYFNNAYYSKVGGVPCSEMNELEVEFLLMTNFTLHVSTDLYVRYYNELASHYVFTSLRSGVPSHQFRHYVVMDPGQVGQLIYVASDEMEEPPLPSYEQEQQQRHIEEQQQAPPPPVYAYQQPPVPVQTNPYTSMGTHHAVTSHQRIQEEQRMQEQQHQQQPALTAPVYSYQPSQLQQQQHPNPYVNKASSHHHLQYQESQYTHYHHSHRSSIEAGAAAYHSTATVPTGLNGKYGGVVAPPGSAAGVASTASNGIVYASTGRTSGQKRRKSIALGVNA